MSLTNELTSRFKAQLVSQFISAVSGAALTVGLARLLEPDTYGLLFLALTVTGTLQLISRLGIGRSAGRYIAEYKETQPEQIPYIVRTSVLVNIGTVLVTTLALLVGHRYIAAVLGELELAPLLLLGTVLIGVGTFLTYLKKVLQGFEAIRFVSATDILSRVSRLILALGFVFGGYGAVGALWGYILSGLIASLVAAVYLYRRVNTLVDNSVQVEAGLRRRIVEYAVPITATNTAHALDKRVDTLLVGFFLSPLEVSFYAIGNQIVNFVEKPMSALGFTLSPTFGSQKAAGDMTQISRIYEFTLINSLLLYVPVGAGMILVAKPLVELLFGTEYSGAIVVLQVLGLLAILKAVTKITDNGLDYLGRARERALVRGVTAILNVLLNILLIPIIGVVGAAIATVATHGIYTAANLYIVAQEFELRTGYLLNRLGLIGLITATMSAVVFSLAGRISGWLTFFSVVGIGVLVWAVLSVAMGLLKPKKVVSLLT